MQKPILEQAKEEKEGMMLLLQNSISQKTGVRAPKKVFKKKIIGSPPFFST
jgi:hypothetical protein